MMQTSKLNLVACILCLASPIVAADVLEMPIWPGNPPGSSKSTLKEAYRDLPISDGTDVARDRHVSGVSHPTLTVYLPDASTGQRVFVVVCPGGGFNILALDKEGHDVARWLQTQGIAAAVVKYRLPDPEIGVFVRNGSISDLQRTIRLVRHHAGEWNVDPQRVGVMGFSAGGYLAAAAGTLFDEADSHADDPVDRRSCRPDFIAPIYPLISLEIERERRAPILERMLGKPLADDMVNNYSLDQRVTPRTPKTFLVHAHDDQLTVDHSLLFYSALVRAGVPAELHAYSRGGHGFGIRQRGQAVSEWPARWLEWMREEGIVQQ